MALNLWIVYIWKELLKYRTTNIWSIYPNTYQFSRQCTRLQWDILYVVRIWPCNGLAHITIVFYVGMLCGVFACIPGHVWDIIHVRGGFQRKEGGKGRSSCNGVIKKPCIWGRQVENNRQARDIDACIYVAFMAHSYLQFMYGLCINKLLGCLHKCYVYGLVRLVS